MNKFFWPESPGNMTFPVARSGYPLITAATFTTVVFALLEMKIPALSGLMITFFICFFFRDPDRVMPNEKNAVISPADGKILSAGIVDCNPYIESMCLKISIFMSLFNVHVNRIPVSGKIKKIDYFPGQFLIAAHDKASQYNEQNAIIIETENGGEMCVVQIAGIIARRIICNLNVNDNVSIGRRFGMICFGSRLDVYLPSDTELNVSIGDKVKGGTSILGYMV